MTLLDIMDTFEIPCKWRYLMIVDDTLRNLKKHYFSSPLIRTINNNKSLKITLSKSFKSLFKFQKKSF